MCVNELKGNPFSHTALTTSFQLCVAGAVGFCGAFGFGTSKATVNPLVSGFCGSFLGWGLALLAEQCAAPVCSSEASRTD